MTPRRRAARILPAALLASLLAAGGQPARAEAAPVSIQPGDVTQCTVDPKLAKRSLRAMWIASVGNLNWPSRTGLTPAQSQAELIAQLDLAKRNGFNAVILQVRPTADTFWPSQREPWSQWLTGSQGKSPGWDPTAFAVQQAHRRGLELHAWVNPYRVAQDATGKKLVSTHPARQHPEWTVSYGGKLYYNPGIPAVRAHVVATITELVARYPVDAVHFDDYFYPYPVSGQSFNDAATYRRYGAGKGLASWRRQNITALVTDARRSIQRTRPGTQLGISPFAVWRNVGTDPQGSQTKAGVQTYDDLYADTRAWVRGGLVDYLTPQVYWSRTLSAARYGVVAQWWAQQAAASPRTNISLGEASYKVGTTVDSAWTKPRELVSHLELASTLKDAKGRPLLRGHVFFDSSSVRANKLDAQGIVAREWYRKPALTPATPWLDRVAPGKPTVRRQGNDLLIRSRGARQVVVYRVDKAAGSVSRCDLADTRNVVAIANHTGRWTIPASLRTAGGTWLVSGVDRASNESAATVVR
ncbi:MULTISPECIES: glycoside hydrolase family 10 protein [unclassified Luteococcus]|uniref:glycoside hydrolase family 10 protein n=1 Tax=unclassified Luteococcus TaxID=2639923 RepID=UPI00313AEC53